jgi:hypothetical protein
LAAVERHLLNSIRSEATYLQLSCFEATCVKSLLLNGACMLAADTAHRFLLSQGSWLSLLEISLRALTLFTLIIFSMRLFGRRVASQYTLFELSVVVTLAGAVGVPLQATNRGLLPPIVIMIAVITVQYAMAKCSVRYPRFEAAISGTVSTIVFKGELQLPELRRAALSRERLFAMLRKRQGSILVS